MLAADRPERFSAGTIVARFDKDVWRVLLLRCYRNWDFPKGELDANEDPLEGAVRETTEETGLRGLRFPWGSRYYETPPYARGKVARYYLAATDVASVELGVNPELGRPEHHEFRWTTFAEAENLLNDRLRPALLWAAHIVLPHRFDQDSNAGEPACQSNSSL